MKILVVCQHYNPEPFRLADICEALAERGHDVSVVTGVPNYPEGEIYPGYEKAAGKDSVEKGVKVHRCFTIPRKNNILFRILNYYSFAISSTCHLMWVREEYDVVFANQLSPVMMASGAIRYAKKWGKKVVLYCLDLWPESLTAGGIRPGSAVYKLFKRISRRIYRKADRILITSKGFASYLNGYLKVETECEYLPQYAEELFDDIPNQQTHQPPYHFVFAGNVGEMQSIDTIIEAARMLKEDGRSIFDIVGDGSAFDHCRMKAKDLPNVIFHGRKDLSEMPEIYEKADGMIVSLRDNPVIAATLPGKVQSYMAAGRAVIGSIGGETAHVIKAAECGISAAPENAEELAQKIGALLDQPDVLCTYGQNARAYYDKYFRKEQFMEKLVQVLEESC